MATGSKKGACSSHTTGAKVSCLRHNSRAVVPGYVNPNLTHLNRVVFSDPAIAGRKSLLPLVRKAEQEYTAKVGQKCQKTFCPFRESVLVIREDTSDEQLMKFREEAEKLTGWKCLGIWVHQDEGHAKSKYIEGEEGFAINHHAHILWDCQNHTTGKIVRIERKDLSKMQDLLSEATGMERGNYATETGRQHRSSQMQRIESQEQRIALLQEVRHAELVSENGQLKKQGNKTIDDFDFLVSLAAVKPNQEEQRFRDRLERECKKPLPADDEEIATDNRHLRIVIAETTAAVIRIGKKLKDLAKAIPLLPRKRLAHEQELQSRAEDAEERAKRADIRAVEAEERARQRESQVMTKEAILRQKTGQIDALIKAAETKKDETYRPMVEELNRMKAEKKTWYQDFVSIARKLVTLPGQTVAFLEQLGIPDDIGTEIWQQEKERQESQQRNRGFHR